MRLSDYLCHDCIIADLRACDKTQVLLELAKTVSASTGLDVETVHAVLLDREKLGSTAVGDGYAIPHGKMPGLEKMLLVFARSVHGVDFAAPDDLPCRLFFMVLAPEGAAGQHLGLLGAIARLAKDASFTTGLLQARGVSELAGFLAAV